MRIRYAFAAAFLVASAAVFNVVAQGWGSFLQFVWISVAIVITGAILWPDDFKRHPPARRDGPPRA
jgi:hypothetical protein